MILKRWIERFLQRLFRRRILVEDPKDLQRLLTAVARSTTQEGGKDPEVNAEKWLRMDKNGQ